MTYILTFQVDGDVLSVHATGDRDSDNPMTSAKDLWTHLALECQERGLSRVLLLSEITGRYPTYDCYEIMSRLDEFGVAKDWKIAYVNSDPQLHDDLSFMTALADHHGFTIRLFEEEDEARKWLLNDLAQADCHWRKVSVGAT